MSVKSAKELTVYIKAYRLSMLIFEVSKRFPVEERYALTGQVRRSSPPVCMCSSTLLGEAADMRRISSAKLTDCDGENNETDTSLDFAKTVGTSPQEHAELTSACAEVGRMLGSMIQNPSPFILSDPRP